MSDETVQAQLPNGVTIAIPLNNLNKLQVEEEPVVSNWDGEFVRPEQPNELLELINKNLKENEELTDREYLNMLENGLITTQDDVRELKELDLKLKIIDLERQVSFLTATIEANTLDISRLKRDVDDKVTANHNHIHDHDNDYSKLKHRHTIK